MGKYDTWRSSVRCVRRHRKPRYAPSLKRRTAIVPRWWRASATRRRRAPPLNPPSTAPSATHVHTRLGRRHRRRATRSRPSPPQGPGRRPRCRWKPASRLSRPTRLTMPHPHPPSTDLTTQQTPPTKTTNRSRRSSTGARSCTARCSRTTKSPKPTWTPPRSSRVSASTPSGRRSSKANCT